MDLKGVILLCVLIIFLGLSSGVCADLAVGVKKGDWIQYEVTYTGSPSPGHDINGAIMEVDSVDGPNITVVITSSFPNGSSEMLTSHLNLQTGQLIDDFIIPANLQAGDTFYDQNIGNVTITNAEQRTYAGAARTVLSTTVGNNSYVWDQATGVSVEGSSQTADYSIHTVVLNTNMWQRQQSLDVTVLVVVVAVAVVAIVLVAVAWALRRAGKLT